MSRTPSTGQVRFDARRPVPGLLFPGLLRTAALAALLAFGPPRQGALAADAPTATAAAAPGALVSGVLVPGAAAPAFEVTGVDGVVVAPSRLQGKVVLVDFWASWCPGSAPDLTWLASMQQRYGAQGLQVLAINVDQNHEDAEHFLADHPTSLLLGFDPANRTPRNFDVREMPTGVLIGPDHRIRWIRSGYDGASDNVRGEAAIRSALGLPARKGT